MYNYPCMLSIRLYHMTHNPLKLVYFYNNFWAFFADFYNALINSKSKNVSAFKTFLKLKSFKNINLHFYQRHKTHIY